jgi:hypothetical protein
MMLSRRTRLLGRFARITNAASAASSFSLRSIAGRRQPDDPVERMA